MGLEIARTGDTYSGGSGAGVGSGTIVTYTTKTFVNGLGVARVGVDPQNHFHLWFGHFFVAATGIIQPGSTSVMVEGAYVARKGDSMICTTGLGPGFLGNCVITSGSSDTKSG